MNPVDASPTGARHWQISGQVQGVGFRPFVHRLATELALRGYVRNRSGRVEVVAAGSVEHLDEFDRRLLSEAPPLAQPHIENCRPCPLPTHTGFSILDSQTGPADIHLPTDQYCCPDCLHELRNPDDRRYRYPFINCTQCGPRYTLIDALPYDRQRTTMAGFQLCPACRAEYDTPGDRRFHAEPLACPVCGPHLWFKAQGTTPSDVTDPLSATIDALHAGNIVAVKGVGGYHLMTDATNAAAVQRLRLCKHRPDKPFAVLFADNVEALQRAVEIDASILAALRSPSRPILLLRRQPSSTLADAVAPGLADIGVMLPGNPLQVLLSEAFGRPLIATSGNLSGEPILTDTREAQKRLTGIADAFLHHNRPIARPADDPVCRPIAGQIRAIRLGRGTAPLEWPLPKTVPETTLAVGGHMKNTIALAWDRRLVLSPHIGDLESPRARDIFAQVIEDLQRLYGVRATRVLCDANPHYASSRWAQACGLPRQAIFHHHAHASALAGEHPHDGRWLVFTWDGVGLGVDGTLWGGEALLGQPGHWRRVASMRPIRLPGGDRAARQPWRSAAALHWEAGDAWHAPATVREAWDKNIHCAVSSAVGRLFDAAAAILDLCREASYEGQGPMQLEALATPGVTTEPLPLYRDDQGIWRCDWQPLLALLRNNSLSVGDRAGIFHVSLAEALVQQALTVHGETPVTHIGLTGGVFQNRRLTEYCVTRLTAEGFNVVLPTQFPANDGALAFGQLMESLYIDA